MTTLEKPGDNAEVLVWDLPIRLFHWLLVLAVLVSFVTGQIGGAWIDWHARSGMAIVGLVVFRLVWGVCGSHTARFSQFVRGPQALRDHLKGEWQGIGHSPLGAVAVLVLLTAVVAQVGSGLFTNDDITFQGPLADLVSKKLSDQLRAWHGWLFYVLAALVAVHVGAIVFYVRVKRDDLVRPMLSGRKRFARDVPVVPLAPVRPAAQAAALLMALTVAGIAVYAAAGGFFSPPPPLPAASTPAW